MTRPSFQFYPADWAANPNLKRCTFAEKGIWLEVMCLFHDQAEYGVLRWTLQEIAVAVKCRIADLRSLQRKGVMKGDDQQLAEPFVYVPRSGRKDGAPVTLVPEQAGPIWFSSRMVKDEYVRGSRADGGGGFDAPRSSPKASPNRAPKGGLGDTSGGGFGPHGSSSSSSSPASPPSEERTSEGRDRRGCRLSATWAPTIEDTVYAISEGFGEREIARMGEGFRDYWIAKPGKDGVKLDWRATWKKWVRTEADRRPVALAPRRVGFV